MRKLLGRIGEWAVTRPAPTIAAVASIVAIVGVVGALRLSPDSTTDKLVDNGSSAYKGTEEFRNRFGDDAIVVLVKGDLDQIVLTDNINRLLGLETCLAGRPIPQTGQYAAPSCAKIAEMGATRVVFGPATFLDEAAKRAAAGIQQQLQSGVLNNPDALQQAQQQLLQSGLGITDLANLSINNTNFVQAIVYDDTKEGAPPKAKRGYLFPSDQAALISIRLQPDISADERREAIGLIRETLGDDTFRLKNGVGYEVSGVPVVVQGLSDALEEQIIVLFAAALAVMALVLIFIFGPPLRLLPLLIAIGSAGFALGLLAILGGTLTMASVAVLPVVIGLGVDYAIQLQARFREAAEQGDRPPAAAVTAAVRGGPVVGTAAVATGVGFLTLALSPIPMVQEFAIALVAGIAAALTISLTAGLAALSMTPAAGAGKLGTSRNAKLDAAVARWRSATEPAAESCRAFGRAALAGSIRAPGRVLIVALVLAITGWVAGTGTKVVSDIRELVPSDLPALAALTDLEEATGVGAEMDVLVTGDVTSAEAITWMSEFKTRVLADHGFEQGQTVSCLDDGVELCPGPSLSDLFDIQQGVPLSQERVDAVLSLVPPYFSQAVLSKGDAADGTEDVAAASFLIPVAPLDEQEKLIEDVRADLDPPDGVEAEVVGLSVLAADANAELSGSRYWLTAVALLAVALTLFAIYRRPSRALVPMLPIALATGWSALVLEAIDVSLNPMSAALGVLVIAVATEFSVILSARYYEEREEGSSIGEALRLTYARTGTAVLASGITSIAGFGVLAFSGITMLRDFGIATVVDLSASVAGVMLVLPAALVWAETGFSPLPVIRARFRKPQPPGDPEPAGS